MRWMNLIVIFINLQKKKVKIIKNIDDGLTAEDDLPKDILTELLKNQDNSN